VNQNGDIAQNMDKISEMVDRQLIIQGISDSTSRVLLTRMIWLLEKAFLGVAFFNRNQSDLFGENLFYNQPFWPLNIPTP
jgi:hypothetical protein